MCFQLATKLLRAPTAQCFGGAMGYYSLERDYDQKKNKKKKENMRTSLSVSETQTLLKIVLFSW